MNGEIYMPKRILAGMFLSLLFNCTAFAGWTSGGGEILKDAQNPWFMPYNTPVVKYCIEIDEKNFGATREQAKKAIDTALGFWKKQFQSVASAIVTPEYKFILAQHQFNEVTCSDATDIKFQFGTLDGAQFAYFKDPTKMVASAVRTDYDTKQLRGRGFVYVSPDSGPLKIQSTEVTANPWSKKDGALLVPVLIHELGHVFGISHNPDIFLMKEDFPETLLSEQNSFEAADSWSHLITSEMLHEFQLFKFTGTTYFSSIMNCGGAVRKSLSNKVKRETPPYTEVTQKFFGFSYDNYYCYGYQMKDYQFTLLGYVYQSTNAAITLGTAKIDMSSVVAPLFSSQTRDLVSMYFPEDQVVFGSGNGPQPYYNGKKFTIVTYSAATKLKGDYVSADGKTKRKITVEIGPFGMITVGGIMDDEIYWDVLTGY